MLMACLVIATAGEIVLSLGWGLYTYRLDNIPLFVPPGHVLLLLLGLSLARRMSDGAALAIIGSCRHLFTCGCRCWNRHVWRSAFRHSADSVGSNAASAASLCKHVRTSARAGALGNMARELELGARSTWHITRHNQSTHGCWRLLLRARCTGGRCFSAADSRSARDFGGSGVWRKVASRFFSERKRLASLRCLSRRGLRPCSAVLAEPAQNRAKALFCLKAPARLRSSTTPKAAPRRQTLAPAPFSWVGVKR